MYYGICASRELLKFLMTIFMDKKLGTISEIVVCKLACRILKGAPTSVGSSLV